MFNCETCFIREMYMYEQVLPTLTKLEVDYRIKDTLRYPLLLGTSKQNGSETLIMEDLAMHGFEMKDRRYPLNWQHCKLVISNFARLHSLSFILKKQKPELFSELSYLPEAFFTGEFMEMYKDKRVEDSFKRNTACLDKEKDETLISKVRYVYDNFVDFYHFCTSGENSNGYNVICHGDGWVNNIFFKYKVRIDISLSWLRRKS